MDAQTPTVTVGCSACGGARTRRLDARGVCTCVITLWLVTKFPGHEITGSSAALWIPGSLFGVGFLLDSLTINIKTGWFGRNLRCASCVAAIIFAHHRQPLIEPPVHATVQVHHSAWHACVHCNKCSLERLRLLAKLRQGGGNGLGAKLMCISDLEVDRRFHRATHLTHEHHCGSAQFTQLGRKLGIHLHWCDAVGLRWVASGLSGLPA